MHQAWRSLCARVRACACMVRKKLLWAGRKKFSHAHCEMADVGVGVAPPTSRDEPGSFRATALFRDGPAQVRALNRASVGLGRLLANSLVGQPLDALWITSNTLRRLATAPANARDLEALSGHANLETRRHLIVPLARPTEKAGIFHSRDNRFPLLSPQMLVDLEDECAGLERGRVTTELIREDPVRNFHASLALKEQIRMQKQQR